MKKVVILMLMVSAVISSLFGLEVKSIKNGKAHYAFTDIGMVQIIPSPATIAEKIKVSKDKNVLIIDASEMPKEKSNIVIRFFVVKNAKQFANKEATATVTCLATPEGSAKVFVEGNAGANKKHVYKVTPYQISADSKDYSTKMAMPKDINSFCVRFDINKPAVYTFSNAFVK